MSGTTPSTVNVFANAGDSRGGFQTVHDHLRGGGSQRAKFSPIRYRQPDGAGSGVCGHSDRYHDLADDRASATTVIRYVTIIRPGEAISWTASALPLTAAAGLDEKLANGQATITADGVVIDGVPVAAPAWLVFTPDRGRPHPTTPSTMQVSVKPGTPVGTYRAVITVAASGDPTLTNPVQLVYVTAIVADNFYFTFLPLVIK